MSFPSGSFLLINRLQYPTLTKHPDNYVLNPEGLSISIDEIRELKEWSTLKPFTQPNKVALLVSFQRATTEAQNALLKVLEEPPAQTMLIIHVDDRENVLPTIKSRCAELPSEYLTRLEIGWDSASQQTNTMLRTQDMDSLKLIIKNAEELSKMSRQELLIHLDSRITELYASNRNNPDRVYPYVQAKKQLLRNVNTRLVLEHLLLQVSTFPSG